uniref:Cyclin-dependent kinases regulatory subunit n=1 Tax=Cyanoderma ruficeps TaxID=181631 RepID=A0A8C3QM83_9PASS
MGRISSPSTCQESVLLFSLWEKHVMLPRELSKQVPKSHLMSEEEWRRLGVQQSLGWVHYMIHEPEPHILLFRRPLPKDEQK